MTMSLTTLSVQPHIYAATNCIVNIHANTVVKINIKSFSVLARNGLYQNEVGVPQHA